VLTSLKGIWEAKALHPPTGAAPKEDEFKGSPELDDVAVNYNKRLERHLQDARNLRESAEKELLQWMSMVSHTA